MKRKKTQKTKNYNLKESDKKILEDTAKTLRDDVTVILDNNGIPKGDPIRNKIFIGVTKCVFNPVNMSSLSKIEKCISKVVNKQVEIYERKNKNGKDKKD